MDSGATDDYQRNRCLTTPTTNTTSVTKAGSGTWTLSGPNTYTGATSVTGGTLIAGGTTANPALGTTTQVNVNGGGMLKLGASSQINTAAPVALGIASATTGGTINTAGFNQTVGALTLNSSSTIDFGAGRSTNTSALQFADSSGKTWASATTLSINDYNGAVYTYSSNAVSGSGDSLFFGTTAGGLTATQLSDIQFVNPDGMTGTFGAMIESNGQVVAAVPEPSTLFGVLLLTGAAGWNQRRRFMSLFGRASRA